MSRHIVIVLAVATMAGAPGLHGQAADTARSDTVRADVVLRLGELRVHGPRALTTAGGTSALQVTRDSLRLGAAPTLEDVLREVPLLHVRTNSRGEAEILARGSESRQVAVLVDGIPLNLTWDARSDVSVVPATAVTGLRFTRGLGSMLHGPNVLGGVVEMSVAGEHDDPPRSVTATAGADHAGGFGGTSNATVPLDVAAGNLLVRVGAGWRNTPGEPLAAGIVEPQPGAGAGLRLNTDARSRDAFAAARYRHDTGAWLSTTLSSSTGARGIAAELDEPAPRFWRYPHVSRTLAVVSGGTGFHGTPFGGTGDLEFSVGYDSGRTEIVAYSDRSYSERSGFENGDDRNLTLRLLGDHTLGRHGDLRGAFTLADIRHDETVPGGTWHYRQRLMSAGVETEWRGAPRGGLFRDVRLSAGGAWDMADNMETGDKPGVPARHAWGARTGVSALVHGRVGLHVGASRRGRFPSLREAFSGALQRFAPNPELGPERLMAVESGVTSHLGAAQLQAVVFAQHLDDAIVRIALPDGRFQRVNESRLRTRGLELLAAYTAGALAIGGDLTVQSATLVSPTGQAGRPENQPAVAGSLFGSIPLPLSASGNGRARFTGRQFCLSASGEDVELVAGTRVDMDIHRSWALRHSPASLLTRAEARLSVDNATNTAIYDQCGLPRPGRLVSIQIRLF